MLGRSKRTHEDDPEGFARQPLLNNSEEDLHHPAGSSNVLFTAGDDDDGDDDYVEASALDAQDSPPPKTGHSVRFREEVQVIAPPLRSTTDSREAGT